MVDEGPCGLGVLDGGLLELVDGGELARDVVRDGLELLELGLELVDDGRVAQDPPVVAKVHRLRRLAELGMSPPHVLIPLLECLEARNCAPLQAQLRCQVRPVDLECRASLFHAFPPRKKVGIEVG